MISKHDCETQKPARRNRLSPRASMGRRDFLSRALQMSAAGLIVPSFLQTKEALAKNSPLWNLSNAYGGGTDHTLGGKTVVMIQLKGGNDGVNTVVPYTDPSYTQIRPTISIPTEELHLIGGNVGLHPSLGPIKNLFDQGKAAVIQGVGYPEMNLSHFRATDIWMSGSSSDEFLETGWLARFLEGMFPNFPNELPPHPYGIQQATQHRIPLQGDRGQTGIVVENPESFYGLVLDSYAGTFDDKLRPTRGGREVGYVRRVDQETFGYAEAIEAAAESGSNTLDYPNHHLGRQMEIIARLISGDLGTPVFIASRGGFDTHGNQLERHAEILDQVATSIAAFMQDLENQGLADDVIVMTVSEFGRRPEENGGFGTDHGTAAPMFVVGNGVNGGLYGNAPSLSDLDQDDNLLVEWDYRGIYGQVLRQHLGGTEEIVEDVLGGTYQSPDFLAGSGGRGGTRLHPVSPTLHAPYPNPVSASRSRQVLLRYELGQAEPVTLEIFDAGGRRVGALRNGPQAAGRHQASWDVGQVAAGTYMVRMRTPDWRQKTKLIVLP